MAIIKDGKGNNEKEPFSLKKNVSTTFLVLMDEQVFLAVVRICIFPFFVHVFCY